MVGRNPAAAECSSRISCAAARRASSVLAYGGCRCPWPECHWGSIATSPWMKVSTSRLLSVPSTRGEPSIRAAARWPGTHGRRATTVLSAQQLTTAAHDPAGHPPARKGTSPACERMSLVIVTSVTRNVSLPASLPLGRRDLSSDLILIKVFRTASWPAPGSASVTSAARTCRIGSTAGGVAVASAVTNSAWQPGR